jgi:hypothetical protein
MLNAPESKRQYPKRLQVLFDFLKLDGDIQEQSKTFVRLFKKDNEDKRDLQKQLIRFAGGQKERVSNKELSPSTVPNYFKAIKLFCQANNLDTKVNWKIFIYFIIGVSNRQLHAKFLPFFHSEAGKYLLL